MILYGDPGRGAALVEAQAAWYGLDLEVQPYDHFSAAVHRGEWVGPSSPMTQLPILRTEDGKWVHESAAIAQLLADVTGRTDLVPARHDGDRTAFLRWMNYIVAKVFPAYDFADLPEAFIRDETAREQFRMNVDMHASSMLQFIDKEAAAPYFFGDRISALDLYIAVSIHRRRQCPWSGASVPRLVDIAVRIEALPEFAPIFFKNFGASLQDFASQVEAVLRERRPPPSLDRETIAHLRERLRRQHASAQKEHLAQGQVGIERPADRDEADSA